MKLLPRLPKISTIKLIKYFTFNSLLIGEIRKPNKLLSIKNIKKTFLKKQIYYDLYNDFCQSSMYCSNINDECTLQSNHFIEYKKYSVLTAEHIFPQSFIKQYKGANLDMHNIYLTISKTNSHRSNYKYIDEEVYLKNNEKYTNCILKQVTTNNFKNNKYKIYIPCINTRGAIARSVAYMKYTYPDLLLENVLDFNLLIKWNFLYPPTHHEIERNNIIKNIQGNDNPFISKYKKIKFITRPYYYLFNYTY